MFQALASYAVRGPMQAALVASSMLVLSTILAPLMVVSSAIIALVWMRSGPQVGALAVGLSLLLSLVISVFTPLPALALAGVILSSWLPVIVMGWVLRDTISLNLAILAGAAVIAMVIVLVYLVVPDPAAGWLTLFNRMLENPDLLPPLFSGMEQSEVQERLETASKYVTGLYAAILFLIAAGSLLLARAWQARLFNPGGLQKEFHQLRFGKTASLVGLAILGAAVLFRFQVLYSFGILVCAVFALQGIAVMHALIAIRGLARSWLIGGYLLLLFIMPESLLFISAVGIADAWLDFREKFANKTREDDGQT